MKRFTATTTLAILAFGFAQGAAADSHVGVMDSEGLSCAAYNAASGFDRNAAYESLLVRPGEPGAGSEVADTAGRGETGVSAGQDDPGLETRQQFDAACAQNPDLLASDVMKIVLGL